MEVAVAVNDSDTSVENGNTCYAVTISWNV
jgi:hypothetical protein